MLLQMGDTLRVDPNRLREAAGVQEGPLPLSRIMLPPSHFGPDFGETTTAAGHVESVLAAAGGPTPVQSQRARPEFSAFGQTQWPLTDQTRFLSSAVCDSRNATIIDLIWQITASQRWGLGALSSTPFKGEGSLDRGAILFDRSASLDTRPAK